MHLPVDRLAEWFSKKHSTINAQYSIFKEYSTLEFSKSLRVMKDGLLNFAPGLLPASEY